MNRKALKRERTMPHLQRIAICVCVAVVAGCAPLIQTSSVPRFSEGGPDAEDYSASKSYPIGDRSTWHRTPFLVGSHSHFDQLFEGRTVRPAKTPSPLRRAAAEPLLRYEYQGQSRTLDD